ncbi:MAG: hypothetical protein AB7F99_15030, partial [Vicinamibacterales bacterium]
MAARVVSCGLASMVSSRTLDISQDLDAAFADDKGDGETDYNIRPEPARPRDEDSSDEYAQIGHEVVDA